MWSKYGYIFLAILVGIYSFVFKTYPIAENFLWLADQIRDWTQVQGGFFSLPRHGTSRVDGYYSIGPIFYWLLWFIRVLVGPFFDNLPHAGGYGLAFFHALADACVVFSLLSYGLSPIIVLAFSLLLVSCVQESALAGIIWNPPVAVAFLEFAFSYILLVRHKFKIKDLVILSTLLILAVQAHTPALFFAFSLFLYATYLYWEKYKPIQWKQYLSAVFIPILLLELPYITYVWAYGPKYKSIEESAVTSSIFNLLKLNPVDWGKSSGVFAVIKSMFLPELETSLLVYAFFILTCLFFVNRKYLSEFLFLGLIPLVLCSFAFVFTNKDIEAYWFISLGPCFLFLFLFLLSTLFDFIKRPWITILLSGVCFIWVLSLLKTRFHERNQKELLSEYGSIVKYCKDWKEKKLVFSRIEGPELRRPTCSQCIYELIGGKLDKNAKLSAKINADGSATILSE